MHPIFEIYFTLCALAFAIGMIAGAIVVGDRKQIPLVKRLTAVVIMVAVGLLALSTAVYRIENTINKPTRERQKHLHDLEMFSH
ncbi:MAG TPA: hypothetical protein VFA52_02090 [Candidatus Paceibacterota bacterium]|nr:hypothetical protein [Candidatus Paceibacterota bacterium]